MVTWDLVHQTADVTVVTKLREAHLQSQFSVSCQWGGQPISWLTTQIWERLQLFLTALVALTLLPQPCTLKCFPFKQVVRWRNTFKDSHTHGLHLYMLYQYLWIGNLLSQVMQGITSTSAPSCLFQVPQSSQSLLIYDISWRYKILKSVWESCFS